MKRIETSEFLFCNQVCIDTCLTGTGHICGGTIYSSGSVIGSDLCACGGSIDAGTGNICGGSISGSTVSSSGSVTGSDIYACGGSIYAGTGIVCTQCIQSETGTVCICSSIDVGPNSVYGDSICGNSIQIGTGCLVSCTGGDICVGNNLQLGTSCVCACGVSANVVYGTSVCGACVCACGVSANVVYGTSVCGAAVCGTCLVVSGTGCIISDNGNDICICNNVSLGGTSSSLCACYICAADICSSGAVCGDSVQVGTTGLFSVGGDICVCSSLNLGTYCLSAADVCSSGTVAGSDICACNGSVYTGTGTLVTRCICSDNGGDICVGSNLQLGSACLASCCVDAGDVYGSVVCGGAICGDDIQVGTGALLSSTGGDICVASNLQLGTACLSATCVSASGTVEGADICACNGSVYAGTGSLVTRCICSDDGNDICVQQGLQLGACSLCAGSVVATDICGTMLAIGTGCLCSSIGGDICVGNSIQLGTSSLCAGCVFSTDICSTVICGTCLIVSGTGCLATDNGADLCVVNNIQLVQGGVIRASTLEVTDACGANVFIGTGCLASSTGGDICVGNSLRLGTSTLYACCVSSQDICGIVVCGGYIAVGTGSLCSSTGGDICVGNNLCLGTSCLDANCVTASHVCGTKVCGVCLMVAGTGCLMSDNNGEICVKNNLQLGTACVCANIAEACAICVNSITIGTGCICSSVGGDICVGNNLQLGTSTLCAGCVSSLDICGNVVCGNFICVGTGCLIVDCIVPAGTGGFIAIGSNIHLGTAQVYANAVSASFLEGGGNPICVCDSLQLGTSHVCTAKAVVTGHILASQICWGSGIGGICSGTDNVVHIGDISSPGTICACTICGIGNVKTSLVTTPAICWGEGIGGICSGTDNVVHVGEIEAEGTISASNFVASNQTGLLSCSFLDGASRTVCVCGGLITCVV